MKHWADVIVHRQEEDLADFRAATLSQRVAAFFIDVTFLSPFVVLVQSGGRGLLFVTILLYFVLPTFLTGQTIGKKIMKLRVINEDFTARLPLGKVVIREMLMILFSMPPFSLVFLMLMVTPEKRAWHDQVTRTRVIFFQ